jgi:hypothetical protein
MLHDWFHYRANCQVMGQSQYGKTSLAEYWCQDHLTYGIPFAIVDGKGPFYDRMVARLAYFRPPNPVVLLDLSDPRFVIPIDFFALPPGADISAHAADCTQLVVNLWGERNTDKTPKLERMLKAIFTLKAVTGEPLHHIVRILELPNTALREWAIDQLPDGEAKYTLQQAHAFSKLANGDRWLAEVDPTQTRLGRFVGSRAIRYFTGLPVLTSVKECIEWDAIVLIKLAPSHALSRESSRIFAGLLLNAFLQAAMQNIDDPKPYYLYCDEAQRYITGDMADMLDLTIASGLRVTLIHHHLDQPPFNDDPHLRSSLEMNAPIKVVFNGLSYAQASAYTPDWFHDEANQRHKKEDRFQYVPEPYDEYVESETESHGTIPSGETNSASITRSVRSVPFYRKERMGQDDYTREEVLAKLAARFHLPRRHCLIKTPDGVRRFHVPDIRDYRALMNPDSVIEYEKAILSNAIPVHEAETIIREAQTRFLAGGNNRAPKPKPPKRPLSPQR